MRKRIVEEATAIKDEIIKIRRRIHQYPELSLEEKKTGELVAEKLEALGYTVTRNVGKTGVVGVLQGVKPGKTIALRADMDALPIVEETDHGFSSLNKGVMHACGHDAHVAIACGAAEILSKLKDEFPGTIKMVFQPSEEAPLGGADDMIAEGVLENPAVDSFLALHITPDLLAGEVGYKEGPFFASVGYFAIDIIGKGGHGAMPHKSINPIPIAAECIQACQSLVSTRIDPMEPLVLSFGSIQGGQKANVIPEKVRLEGTVRCFSDELMEEISTLMEEIIRSKTSPHGASYKFVFNQGVKTLINDISMIKLVKEASVEILGQEKTRPVSPVLLGDDFASFSKKVPSAYFFLGAGFADKQNYPLHHPKF
ncbi:MAG: amidohydrolase, partial [Desulfitobacterium sp.]|nr:amidohydrolase [Desulfitobacterium sp.]